MRRSYRKKCLWVMPSGVGLLGLGIALWWKAAWAPLMDLPLVMGILVAGAILHLWGCALMAKGKGYSGALVAVCAVVAPIHLSLTMLLPFAIVLVLPDKNR